MEKIRKSQSQIETYRKKGQRPRITACLDLDVYQKLLNEAEKEGKNISWFVNDFLKKNL